MNCSALARQFAVKSVVFFERRAISMREGLRDIDSSKATVHFVRREMECLESDVFALRVRQDAVCALSPSRFSDWHWSWGGPHMPT